MDYNLFRTTLIVFLLLNLAPGSTISRELVSERTILLELKKSLSDSSGILSSWKSNSSDHCSWFGVSCDSKSRVIAVNITGCDAHAAGIQSGFLNSPSRSDGKTRACDDVGSGKLAGKIPACLGKLTRIRVLSLPSNSLSGEIPREIWGLEKLNVLDLERNHFSGKLPNRIPGLNNLRVLNLGFNQISGDIPLSLKKFNQLESLNLSGNQLEGSIPNFLGDFRKLTRLDLANNRLNGPIPTGIERNFRCFKHLDLSGNYLIKDSRDSVYCHTRNIFFKHRKLASFNGENEVSQEDANSDSNAEFKSKSAANSGLNPIEIASISTACAIVSVLLVLVILFLYARKWSRNSRVEVVESKEIRVFQDIGIPLTYENVVRATGNFSNTNCIGSGGFGSTYKAEISPGTFLAVKKLSVGRFQGVQQFDAEIMALEMVRHPNLVKLIGFHTSTTEMFLIYNYLPGGNLEDFIKERPKAAFEWKIIHKISLHIARALAYLHDRCSPKVMHRDVKPSNILLDNEFNAYLSDFGLARLLSGSQTHATTGVAGTFAYVAPEYAMTCRVSEKADVYSYGIVLLELLSDKKALDPSFSSHENGFNIVSWAHMKLRQGKGKNVFTAGLWEAGPHDDLMEILHLALKCTVGSFTTRPVMRHVVQRLKQIKPS